MLCGTKGNLFKVLEYLCVISSPLTNKTKGEKSWLSGSFHKQQHDKKFMASQHQETEFCCPLEKQKATVPLDASHPTFLPKMVGKLGMLVA